MLEDIAIKQSSINLSILLSIGVGVSGVTKFTVLTKYTLPNIF